jgi:prepilin-type N-terminal cleavage/methylation domain-containing protein
MTNVKTMLFRIPHSALRIRNAFTLIELIVAALVLGILTAAAVPTFVNSIMYHRVESAAVRLKRDLELARQMSVTKSTDFSLEFTTATSYRIPNVDSLDHVGQMYQIDLARPPHSVLVTSVDFGGTNTVTFNGYGTPSTDGSVVLRAGTHQREVGLSDQGIVSVTRL